MSFELLALVKNTKGVVFDGVFSFFDYFTTVQAFPAFKVNKMIKKGLHDH